MCMCLHAHAHGSVCMRILPFSLFYPLYQHNPSVYEITRAHLCSGGSHLGSKEASTGNHLGSTQSSFHSASSVLSTLWPKLFTLKRGGNEILCVCVRARVICKVSQIKLLARSWYCLFTQSGQEEEQADHYMVCSEEHKAWYVGRSLLFLSPSHSPTSPHKSVIDLTCPAVWFLHVCHIHHFDVLVTWTEELYCIFLKEMNTE